MKKLIVVCLFLAGCGQQGPVGPQGPTGQNGGSCSTSPVLASVVAPNGGALISCADGTQAMILNGTNGTVVGVVQFCKNPVTTYPSTFNEVGFCINNTLYAVYSANGGFETTVLPGGYSSNGINSSCTFTVGPNCTITNQSN